MAHRQLVVADIFLAMPSAAIAQSSSDSSSGSKSGTSGNIWLAWLRRQEKYGRLRLAINPFPKSVR
ncbi:hypothetical protein KGO5_02497 [Sinorhizobium sp. KGO-5]|nr:hypothetical protein KGO5_02497 [Sinorhizobium sp. KGO-5]